MQHAIVRYLGPTNSKGAHWRVRLGGTTLRVPYDYTHIGVTAAIDAVRRATRGADLGAVIYADYDSGLGAYVVVFERAFNP